MSEPGVPGGGNGSLSLKVGPPRDYREQGNLPFLLM